jgi:WD40 repeat protein
VWSVNFSPDGKILASGSVDSTVRLWQVSDGTLLRALKNDGGQIRSVAFSPDGATLASSAAYGITLWGISDGTQLNTLEGHTSWIPSITFSPDGTILASGSGDCTIRLWGIP